MIGNYPNLIAEIQYSGVSRCTLADHAGVSEAIMQNVLDGDDALTLDEIIRVAALFKGYTIPNDWFSFEYLLSEELLVIDVRKMELMGEVKSLLEKLEDISEVYMKPWHMRDIARLSRIAKEIDARMIIPYAQYRHFCRDVLLLAACISKKERVRIRRLEDTPIELEMGIKHEALVEPLELQAKEKASAGVGAHTGAQDKIFRQV